MLIELEQHGNVDVVQRVFRLHTENIGGFTALRGEHHFGRDSDSVVEFVLHQDTHLIVGTDTVLDVFTPKVCQVEAHLGAEAHLCGSTEAEQSYSENHKKFSPLIFL